MRKKAVAGMAAAMLIVGACRARRERQGASAHAVLAEDPLASVRARHASRDPSGRTASEAPPVPGYITGLKEMALVDSKDPDAKPLPIAKMMVHHFLYFAPGTTNQAPGSCWSGSGFIGGRGEEHPLGRMATELPASTRRHYGITNRTAAGRAPDWRLTAMVMNHYKKPKSFYIRTRVHYTTEKRTPVMPPVIGNCNHLRNGMSYDVPGGGKQRLQLRRKSDWVAPEGLNGRMLIGVSHNHGGAKYQTLESRTCGRRIFKARAYHGNPDHVYNTIRPILHEPGPIGNGTFPSRQGVPITEGEVLRRVAVHDNHNLHVASMGFWFGLIRERRVREALRSDAERPDRHQPAEALRPHAEPRSEGAPARQAAAAPPPCSTATRSRSATTSSGPARSPRRPASR